MDLTDVVIEAVVDEAARLDPADAFDLFLGTAARHRKAAEHEYGFSPEAAETMAVALHSGLVALYFTSGVTP